MNVHRNRSVTGRRQAEGARNGGSGRPSVGPTSTRRGDHERDAQARTETPPIAELPESPKHAFVLQARDQPADPAARRQGVQPAGPGGRHAGALLPAAGPGRRAGRRPGAAVAQQAGRPRGRRPDRDAPAAGAVRPAVRAAGRRAGRRVPVRQRAGERLVQRRAPVGHHAGRGHGDRHARADAAAGAAGDGAGPRGRDRAPAHSGTAESDAPSRRVQEVPAGDVSAPPVRFAVVPHANAEIFIVRPSPR